MQISKKKNKILDFSDLKKKNPVERKYNDLKGGHSVEKWAIW